MSWSVTISPIGDTWRADAEIDGEHVYSCVGSATRYTAVDSAVDFVSARLMRTRQTDPAMAVVSNDLPSVAGEIEGKS